MSPFPPPEQGRAGYLQLPPRPGKFAQATLPGWRFLPPAGHRSPAQGAALLILHTHRARGHSPL